MRVLKIIKANYFILITTFLFIYILFNLLDGERGLFSYLEKKKIYNELIKKKHNLNIKLVDIDKKTLLLSESIDLDYLEIVFRNKFFYGKSNEHVYLINTNES